MNGRLEMLAGNVPERNVDGADRGHDGRAAEMRPAIHILPVVLDAQRVAPKEIVLETGYRARGRFMKSPGTALPQPDEPVIRTDFDEEILVDKNAFDAFNAHVQSFPIGPPTCGLVFRDDDDVFGLDAN